MENKYNTEKAKEYRTKLNELSDKCAELQYQMFIAQKELKEVSDEYQIYLGVKEPPKEEKEVADVQES